MYDLGSETNEKLIGHFKLSHSAGNEFVHQRIRPIVLCLATLLESGGKISSLIKLYKTQNMIFAGIAVRRTANL